ncbi:recombinase family protein [Ruminococcus sp.]|uniref:recombinase family protein n=1 Tax=Ruminococcus sp. TaxID=41978 RepID=UPI0025D40C1C|nr:recombinase family protein [Ruminococcus sp.]MBR1432210.1 recombinase family protein [Ruminococcus sp.]MBR1824649.1 recombinase family protein [Ruminococcus sp.]
MKTESNTEQITALYCRLSQEDFRAGESLSIENQRLMLKDYADKNGFRNCQYYIDDGYSGTDNTRPEYVHMLSDVENGLVGTVIVKDQSRLGRDHLETDRLMELVFPAYDVRFIAVTDNVDSANGFNEMSGIKNLFNDMYARDTSKKIRAVQRAKGERGERVGTTTPYGYMKDENKHLMPNPETAPVVKRIFEMSAEGKGIRKICDILSAEKILCPSAYAAQKVGKPKTKPYHWAQKTVREMLANRIYCGDTVNFSTYTKSYKLKKTLKNEPENMLIFENTHEAIISRKLFDVVQKHYEGRKKSDKFGETDKYAGYLYCAECGSRLYISRSKKMDRSKFHYMCAGYQSRITDCTAHYIREEVLDSIVLRYLRQVISYARDKSDEFYAMAMANGKTEAQKQFKENEKLISEYETRITQLDNAIQLLYMDRSNGKITDERYDILSANFEKEQYELKSKLNAFDSQLDEMKVREQRVREFINNAKQYTEIRRLTPEILKSFIGRIEVYEKAVKHSRTCGNRVVVYFTFSADKEVVIDRVISENGDMLVL